MSFSFEQWAEEQRSHILTLARTPGWVGQAKLRAQELAEDWPELFADLPAQREAATAEEKAKRGANA